jgi:hypothetical protein
MAASKIPNAPDNDPLILDSLLLFSLARHPIADRGRRTSKASKTTGDLQSLVVRETLNKLPTALS